MPKYSFERLGPDRFEALALALLKKNFRIAGNLIQFGDGKDGAREATWTQPTNHPEYVRPSNESADVPKHWVFQVKFHDLGLKGWFEARKALEADLGKELQKLVDKHKVPCHKYILITNVPLTGVRHTGTRDKLTKISAKWQNRVPEILTWDAVDLSAMLDADPQTRTTFLGDILPGNILRSLLENINIHANTLKHAMRHISCLC